MAMNNTTSIANTMVCQDRFQIALIPPTKAQQPNANKAFVQRGLLSLFRKYVP